MTLHLCLDLADVIRYPMSFVNDVKREFPELYELHHELDSGAVMPVGNMLNEKRQFECTADRILTAFENGLTRELHVEVARIVRREALYAVWYDLWKNHEKKMAEAAARAQEQNVLD